MICSGYQHVPFNCGAVINLIFTKSVCFLLQYMFFFQLPYLPEFVLERNDYELINKAFQVNNKMWQILYFLD